MKIITVDSVGYLGDYDVESGTLTETSRMKDSLDASFNYRVRQMLRDNLRTISVTGNTSVTVQDLSPAEARDWEAVLSKKAVAELVAVPNLIIKEFGG